MAHATIATSICRSDSISFTSIYCMQNNDNNKKNTGVYTSPPLSESSLSQRTRGTVATVRDQSLSFAMTMAHAAAVTEDNASSLVSPKCLQNRLKYLYLCLLDSLVHSYCNEGAVNALIVCELTISAGSLLQWWITLFEKFFFPISVLHHLLRGGPLFLVPESV